jgi:AcrR family transcriptional regulator
LHNRRRNWENDSLKAPDLERREHILFITARCVLAKGMHQTSMEDIARLAGVSRRTLYRIFPGRQHLYAALFEARVNASIFGRVRQRVAKLGFVSSLLEATIYSTRLMRRDPLLMEMMYGSGGPWFYSQLLDSRSPLFSTLIATQLRFWSEPLDKARRDGIINPKLNNRHIAEWHLSALYLLVVRVDRSEAEQRFLVENLLIPSLLRRTKG